MGFKRTRTLGMGLVALVALLIPARGLAASQPSHPGHFTINCAWGWAAQNCTELADDSVFGHYVGHDEPSTLFYSNQPGSGTNQLYHLTLPQDPPTMPRQADPKVAWNFQLHPAFWFGMALCDTQSFPLAVSTCPADSDTNIHTSTNPNSPSSIYTHPGTAFMEMQFYPPGWVNWPAGDSCDAREWCAALNIDSYSFDAIHGQLNNSACVNSVGVEPVNFAFLTHNGVPTGPPNPVQATGATFTPDPARDLFMNSGDQLTVHIFDTANGLRVDVNDLTSGQSGTMTASAANGFGQVKFDPNATTCTNIPYNFHAEYSTSSPLTTVPWAAHSYNIAFADEIGHFDYCTGATVDPGADCPTGNTEGTTANQSPADDDDTYCLPVSWSSLVPVQGCLGTNTGFDGVSYQKLWPDGNTAYHGTPITFSSPVFSPTGSAAYQNYSQAAFEADLPRIEFDTCNRSTGSGCYLIPRTDQGTPANFYPYFSTGQFVPSSIPASPSAYQGCAWMIGDMATGSSITGISPSTLAEFTTSDFGKNSQYGSLLNTTYIASGSSTVNRYNNFRHILPNNPCPAPLP